MKTKDRLINYFMLETVKYEISHHQMVGSKIMSLQHLKKKFVNGLQIR